MSLFCLTCCCMLYVVLPKSRGHTMCVDEPVRPLLYGSFCGDMRLYDRKNKGVSVSTYIRGEHALDR